MEMAICLFTDSLVGHGLLLLLSKWLGREMAYEPLRVQRMHLCPFKRIKEKTLNVT